MNELAPKNSKNFPKHRRLLKHEDFEHVYKQGRRHFSAHMTVFYLRRDLQKEDSPGGLRVGFTVGKVLGGAVQRNRMKRRLREAVRLASNQPDVAADVVVNPKRSLLTAQFADIQNEMSRAFQVIENTLKTLQKS